jgi:hypothetical protein
MSTFERILGLSKWPVERTPVGRRFERLKGITVAGYRLPVVQRLIYVWTSPMVVGNVGKV